MLAADAITFGYPNQPPILREWSVQFEAGTVVAIAGPSGRGKSTLLYLLGLMLKPVDGRVLLDNQSVAELADSARAQLRAKAFGFVFQDAALDPTRTVIDNVIETALYRGRPRQEELAKARELMRRFGVDARADHKPGQISGGQAQRIAICRALLNDPRVLLADEPTGNLDHASAVTVWSALREQADSGASVIVATHDSELMSQCDMVIQL